MATLHFEQKKCTLCGQCVEKCPFGALEIKDNKIEINASCKMCKICVKSLVFARKNVPIYGVFAKNSVLIPN